MRVLYIHQYFATRRASTGTRSYEFARRLVQSGHEVLVLTGGNGARDLLGRDLNGVEEVEVEGIRVRMVDVKYDRTASPGRKALSFLQFMWRSTLEALKASGIDVVFATSTPLTVAVPALAVRLLRRIPYVFEVRDLWPEVPIQFGVLRNPILKSAALWLEKVAYHRASHIIALSDGMRDGIVSRGITSSKVTVIPNCADVDLFKPDIPVDPDLAKRFEGRFVCVHAGAMGKINGLGVVLDAAVELQRRNDDTVHFLLIGNGTERNRLIQRAESLGLNNVTITGPVPKEKLPSVLNACQACLVSVAPVPILETNSANKFFDYLAMGKPVIINYGGWMKQVLEQANAGESVPYDPSALADALVKLKGNPGLCRIMGQNARNLAENTFNRELLFERLTTVLESALLPQEGRCGRKRESELFREGR